MDLFVIFRGSEVLRRVKLTMGFGCCAIASSQAPGMVMLTFVAGSRASNSASPCSTPQEEDIAKSFQLLTLRLILCRRKGATLAAGR